MATVTIHAQINLPQLGLKAGETGDADKDLAEGLIARGYALVVDDAPKPKKASAASDGIPTEE